MLKIDRSFVQNGDMYRLAPYLLENSARKKRWEKYTKNVKDNWNRICLENYYDNSLQFSRSELPEYKLNLLTPNLTEEEKAHWIQEAGSTSSDVVAYNTYAFPLIRRMLAQQRARELVSFQPIPLPVGLIFFMDFMYQNTIYPTTAEDPLDVQRYGLTAFSGTTEATRRGKFNPYYSLGARGEIPTGAINSSNDEFISPCYTAYGVPIKNAKAYVDSVEVAIDADGAGSDYAIGKVELVVAPTTGSVVTLDWDFDFEGATTPNKLKLKMSSDTVTVEERRLAYEWTYELQQDLAAYHNFDAPGELTKMAIAEMAAGEDRVIINDLISNVGHNVNWAKTYPGVSSGYSRNEYDATLLSKSISTASTAIFKKRGVQANFIVVGADELDRMDQLSMVRYEGNFKEGGTLVSGLNYIGTVKNTYKVYADQQIASGTVLVGHKGEGFARTGYVYAQYQPIVITPVINNISFKPEQAMMTRAGRKLISADFYATVTLV
jgi:hypothetical protein